MRFLSFLFTFSTNVFRSGSGFSLVAVFFFITVNCITICWYEATIEPVAKLQNEGNVLDLGTTEDVLSEVDMAFTKPQYSRREVNEAGTYLLSLMRQQSVDPKNVVHAFDVLHNFRAAHAFPMHTIQNNLRTRASVIDRNSIVVQRLKRLSSIWKKLDRFNMMRLWDMQDIGGCRAIVRNLDCVQRLVESYKSSSIRHRLAGEKDYIQEPRDSGYRSRHLIYRYVSDRNELYNGLKIEIQIRTPLQHAWATTVETVDAFTEQALKSSRGMPEWERFFQLMGTEMAFREGTPPVPNTPTDRGELRKEIKECARELKVVASLLGFMTALRVARRASRGADYFLLSLDNIKRRLNIIGYKRKDLTRASNVYDNKEQKIRNKPGMDTVLVSVDSIRNLQRAYPNYFADTRIFVTELKRVLK